MLEILQALENLKKKAPMFDWRIGHDQKFLYCCTKPASYSNGQSGNYLEKAFIGDLKVLGIELDCFVSADALDERQFEIEAKFREPLVIKSMANNVFTLPKLDPAENDYIARILSKKTGIKWVANTDGTMTLEAWVPKQEHSQYIVNTALASLIEFNFENNTVKFPPEVKNINEERYVPGHGGFKKITVIFRSLILKAMLEKFKLAQDEIELLFASPDTASELLLSKLPEPVIAKKPVPLTDSELRDATLILNEKAEIIGPFEDKFTEDLTRREITYTIKPVRGRKLSDNPEDATKDYYEKKTGIRPDYVSVYVTAYNNEINRLVVGYVNPEKVRVLLGPVEGIAEANQNTPAQSTTGLSRHSLLAAKEDEPKKPATRKDPGTPSI